MGLKQATCLLLLCTLVATARAAAPRPSLRGLHGRSLQQNTGLLCSAESNCIGKACTAAYANDANDFPYSLTYTRSGDDNATTFIFSLCSQVCKSSNEFCHPLSAFQLRLSDKLVSQPRYIQRLSNGSLVQQCSPRGPGVLWNRPDLGALGTSSATKVNTCELFLVSVFHPVGDEQLQLKDICQQDVQLVNKNGKVLFDQADAGASCLFILETTDKSSGYAVLKQKDSEGGTPAKSPALPKSPPAVVKPQAVSPSPVAQPSPSPSPSAPVRPQSTSPSPAVIKPQGASPSSVPSPSPSPALPSPSPSPALPSPSPSPAASASPAASPSPSAPTPAPYYSPSPYAYSPSPAYSSPAPYYSSPPPNYAPTQGRRLFGSSNMQFQAWSSRVLGISAPAIQAQGRRLAVSYAPPSPPSYSPSPYAYSPSPAYYASPSPAPYYSPPTPRRRMLSETALLFGLGSSNSLFWSAGLPQGRRLAAPVAAYSPSPVPYYSPSLPSYSPSPNPYSPPLPSPSPYAYSPPAGGRRLSSFASGPGMWQASTPQPAATLGRRLAAYAPSPSPYAYSPSPSPAYYASPSPAPYYAYSPSPSNGRRLAADSWGLPKPLFGLAARAPAAHLVWPAATPALPQGLRRLAAAAPPSPPVYGYSPSPLPYYSPQVPAYSPPAYSPPPYAPERRRLQSLAPAPAVHRLGRQILGASPPAYYSPGPSPPTYYSPSPVPSYYSPSPAPYYAPQSVPAPAVAGSRRLFGEATEFGTTAAQLRQWSRQMMAVSSPSPPVAAYSPPAYSPSPVPYYSPPSYSPSPYASPPPYYSPRP